ncbi:helix-turn-helix domain-containing protein [Gracilibacillus sp. S3-1-1]|uniref:Helix-turn-helix domain-containing protein n=1 Tax=Gracilibacillus pellucidus TaxID=3095368 RepID=A0ACC6M8D8_9BACI|nr:helix-turn-helix domain-containing protein [Gracilibacillus sp. S3-1-1]MDX8047133.1 helix-turn-helix domain-containing protein [Gracilibacillus sp. S3-1-1]
MNEKEKSDFLYTFGQLVKNQRILKGLTQDEVAEILEVSTNAIYLLEKGELDTKSTRFVPLIHILDIPYSSVQEPFLLFAAEPFEERLIEVMKRKENKRR